MFQDHPFFHNFHPYTYSPPPQQPPSQRPRPKKVVSIPVRHVDTSKTRPESATKIQKAFRGFWVRKTVKKILELKQEVDNVEKKVLEGETMELIRRNKLERLKVTESLMAILFKLDSIRGINGGVREVRKSVINKVIMLQEVVDGVVNDNGCKVENSGGIDVNGDELMENFEDSREFEEEIGGEKENFDDSRKFEEEIDGETLGEDVEINEMENFHDSSKMQVENSEEIGGETLSKDFEVNEKENFDDLIKNSEEIGGETLGDINESFRIWEKIDGNEDEMENFDDLSKISEEIGGETLGEVIDDSTKISEKIDGSEDEMLNVDDSSAMQAENPKKIEEIVEDEAIADDNIESWECIGFETDSKNSKNTEFNNVGVENYETMRNSGKGSSSSSCKEKILLEKMVEDNQKLMAMVADLCHKNASQTALICSLSRRVEQVEKAMNDKLRKKKNKKMKKCNDF